MEDHSTTLGVTSLALIFIVLSLLAGPLHGQQDVAAARERSNTKSALRNIYDEDQKDKTDEAGDANPENKYVG
jgi:hypothetical protein